MLEPLKQLGKVGYDDETGLYWGKVIHLCEVETFRAGSVAELQCLMRESAVVWKETPDKSPESSDPFFESLMISIDPWLYSELVRQATQADKSLNEWVLDVLKVAVNRSRSPEPV